MDTHLRVLFLFSGNEGFLLIDGLRVPKKQEDLMKKGIALLLALVVLFSLAACGSDDGGNEESTGQETEGTTEGVAKEDIKVGFIFLHDENSTYDKNFMDAATAMQEELGLTNEQVRFITNVPESNEAQEAAEELVDWGADLVFADSFGHEDYILAVAEENPDVLFCHATGTKAHTSGLDNYFNAFAKIHQARFLAGVVAGYKMNEMIENGEITEDEAKVGYVGAMPFAEVKSGYTAFFLGVREVCPSATMEVVFTNSWYDEALEKEAANTLIADGCVVISQHADSMGAPTACEAAGVPNVAYNGSTINTCPTTALTSSHISWQPYFTHIVEAVLNGTPIEQDFSGGLKEGTAVLGPLNEDVVAEGTAEKVEELRAQLENEEIYVFDTAKFTVDGNTLDSYQADVDSDPDFTPDTEVIEDGIFLESEFRSAPYFDIDIDGINIR